MGQLDDFFNTSIPDVFASSTVVTVTRRDNCHVCNSLFTLANPQFREGSYWCTKCGDFFDGCTSEPTHHKMWINVGDANYADREPLGQFIGFAGYNQLLVLNNLEPKHVFTTHPREGVLAGNWHQVYEKLAPNWNKKLRR